MDDYDKNGCTPLFASVRAGASPAVLQLLLDRGAEVDAAPDGEPTSLALASGMGCLRTVRLLVRERFEQNKKHADKQSQDQWRIHQNHITPE